MDDPRTAAQRALPLVDNIYASAVNPALWTGFLEALSAEVGGAAIAMSLALPGTSAPTEYYRTGLSAKYVPVFERHFARGLPWGPMTHAAYRAGFGRGGRIFPDAELPATEYYREYMQPQGLAAEGPLAHLIQAQDGNPTAGISIMRRVGDRPFDDDDVSMCNLLIPHLSRSYAIRRQLRGTRRDQGIRAEVLDRIPTGIVLVEARRRVIGMNHAGFEILSQRDGIYLEDDVLRVSDRRDEEAIGGLIEESISESEPDQSASGFMTIQRPSGQMPFGILVSPLLAPRAGEPVGDRVTSVFISDPTMIAPGPGWFENTFQNLYSLTPAENQLVQLLAEGRSLEQISDVRNVSIHTTRSQLKRIFGKTGTSRQADLVRLALAGVATVRSH